MQPPPSTLRDRFLAGMASAAATVNVVTTDGPGGRYGITVSAMSSVSADTPRPTLLVCVHHASPAARAIRDNGVFCVNVLRDDQSYIADCFAGRFRTADGDRFSCARFERGLTGAPRVVDPLVAFDCVLVRELRVGTHHVFFGEVAGLFLAAMGTPGAPLIYANRAYGTPALHAGRVLSSAPGEALRIGVAGSFGPFVVPRVVAALTRAGHAIALHLLEGDQRRVAEGLQAGEVDAALLEDHAVADTLDKVPVATLRYYVLLAADHPLAARPTLGLAELAAEPMVLLETGPGRSAVLGLFERAGWTPDIHLRTQSLEMARGFVGQGLGFCVLDARPAGALAYDGRLVTTRPLADATPSTRIVLALPRRATAPPLVEAFRAACLDVFAGRHEAPA